MWAVFCLPLVAHADGDKPAILMSSSSLPLTKWAYEKSEVKDVATGQIWMAIISKGYHYIAKSVNVTVKSYRDQMFETDMRAITVPKDTVLLVKGLPISEGQSIRSYPLNATSLKPGKRIIIDEYKDISLISKLPTADPKNTTSRHYYQIYVVINGTQQVLTKPAEINMIHPKILWTGDINNDAYPDFVITTADHYAMFRPILFISKKMGRTVHYTKVAQREVWIDT